MCLNLKGVKESIIPLRVVGAMFSPLVHQNGPLQTTVPDPFDLRLGVLIPSVMRFPVAVWVLRGDWCVAGRGWLAATLKIKEIFI